LPGHAGAPCCAGGGLLRTDGPAAEALLGDLLRYLEEALPRLREACTTLGRETELVRTKARCSAHTVRGTNMTRALIAEDEPLLAAAEQHQPDVMFVDVQVPGLDGLEVARILGAQAHVVFIWQVHRGTVVNVNAVRSVLRGMSGKLMLQLKQRPEKLEVSATYAHRFRQL
jgi:CheY-like chemotaxis protein